MLFVMDIMRKSMFKYIKPFFLTIYTRAASISRTKLLIALVLTSVLIIVVGYLLLSRVSPTQEPQTSLILQQSYDGSLPVKPINQAYYQSVIQSSWDEALERGSTNIVNFPNDPNLVAFQYKSPETTTPASFVLYRNKPIILRTKKVLELPNRQLSRLTLSHEKYQLVVLFEFTPEVKELDIAPLLTETFKTIVKGRG